MSDMTIDPAGATPVPATGGDVTTTSTLTRLCDLSDVSEDLPFRAEVGDMAWAVFQAGDLYYVIADQCTHGPGLMSDGYLDDCDIECPFHQGRFDIRTGIPTSPPCEVPMRVWTPIIVDGGVHIDAQSPLEV
jgi:anthranilate 1,2-dioxygenase ferredoxin subunit